MNATNRCLGSVVYVLMLLMVFAGSLALAQAQGVEATIPTNATATTYGGGWECDRGYRKADGKGDQRRLQCDQSPCTRIHIRADLWERLGV